MCLCQVASLWLAILLALGANDSTVNYINSEIASSIYVLQISINQ